jgi:hypothetical protein
MGLSIKNNWLDGSNRAFIYFTLEEACSSLNCGHDKGVKIMAELDAAKGVGLIERVKQGLGKPCKIYVKNCIAKTEAKTSEKPQSGETENGNTDCGKPEAQTSENPRSGVRETSGLDFGNADGNKTEYIKTDISETDQSIYPAGNQRFHFGNGENEMDTIDGYREILAENVSYAALCDNYGTERMAGVLDILTETVCTKKRTVRIGGEDMPAEVVRSRLLKLNSLHIDYVFECMDANTTKIQNIRAYLLTALFRAPTTMEPYYQAEVSHDLRGGG